MLLVSAGSSFKVQALGPVEQEKIEHVFLKYLPSWEGLRGGLAGVQVRKRTKYEGESRRYFCDFLLVSYQNYK